MAQQQATGQAVSTAYIRAKLREAAMPYIGGMTTEKFDGMLDAVMLAHAGLIGASGVTEGREAPAVPLEDLPGFEVHLDVDPRATVFHEFDPARHVDPAQPADPSFALRLMPGARCEPLVKWLDRRIRQLRARRTLQEQRNLRARDGGALEAVVALGGKLNAYQEVRAFVLQHAEVAGPSPSPKVSLADQVETTQGVKPDDHGGDALPYYIGNMRVDRHVPLPPFTPKVDAEARAYGLYGSASPRCRIDEDAIDEVLSAAKEPRCAACQGYGHDEDECPHDEDPEPAKIETIPLRVIGSDLYRCELETVSAVGKTPEEAAQRLAMKLREKVVAQRQAYRKLREETRVELADLRDERDKARAIAREMKRPDPLPAAVRIEVDAVRAGAVGRSTLTILCPTAAAASEIVAGVITWKEPEA